MALFNLRRNRVLRKGWWQTPVISALGPMKQVGWSLVTIYSEFLWLEWDLEFKKKKSDILFMSPNILTALNFLLLLWGQCFRLSFCFSRLYCFVCICIMEEHLFHHISCLLLDKWVNLHPIPSREFHSFFQLYVWEDRLIYYFHFM